MRDEPAARSSHPWEDDEEPRWDDAPPARASVSMRVCDAMRLLRVTGGESLRNAFETSAADGRLGFAIQMQGRSEISHGGQVVRLQFGDWSFVELGGTHTVQSSEAADLLIVQLPERTLAEPAFAGFGELNGLGEEGEAGAHGGRHGLRRGSDATLAALMRVLADRLGQLPGGAERFVADMIVALLVSVLPAHPKPRGDLIGLRDVMRARVKQYVDVHLGDANLSVDGIAAALRCSKRYLHRVFEGEPQTLERYIWQSRLERCRRSLEEPQAASKAISQIAFDWGFNSSAHFCRLFKRRFGVAPRDCRKQALELS